MGGTRGAPPLAAPAWDGALRPGVLGPFGPARARGPQGRTRRPSPPRTAEGRTAGSARAGGRGLGKARTLGGAGPRNRLGDVRVYRTAWNVLERCPHAVDNAPPLALLASRPRSASVRTSSSNLKCSKISRLNTSKSASISSRLRGASFRQQDLSQPRSHSTPESRSGVARRNRSLRVANVQDVRSCACRIAVTTPPRAPHRPRLRRRHRQDRRAQLETARIQGRATGGLNHERAAPDSNFAFHCPRPVNRSKLSRQSNFASS